MKPSLFERFFLTKTKHKKYLQYTLIQSTSVFIFYSIQPSFFQSFKKRRHVYSEDLMKKAKRNHGIIKMNDCFSTLPDDVFLIILQYSTKDDIVSTRAFQSSWVQECTVDVYMKMAAWKHNLNNMKWINERYQNTLRSNWQDEINYGNVFLLLCPLYSNY